MHSTAPPPDCCEELYLSCLMKVLCFSSVHTLPLPPPPTWVSLHSDDLTCLTCVLLTPPLFHFLTLSFPPSFFFVFPEMDFWILCYVFFNPSSSPLWVSAPPDPPSTNLIITSTPLCKCGSCPCTQFWKKIIIFSQECSIRAWDPEVSVDKNSSVRFQCFCGKQQN